MLSLPTAARARLGARTARSSRSFASPGTCRALGLSIAFATALAGGFVLTSAAAHATNPPPTGSPVGYVNTITANQDGSLAIAGWAADRDDVTQNATVYGLVDGHIVTKAVTSIARPRVTAQRHVGPTPGFAMTVPVPATGIHTVCVGVHNIGAGLATLLTCTSTPLGSTIQQSAHSPVGKIALVSATASTVHVTGWASEPDFRARRITAVLYIDGAPATTFVTHPANAGQQKAGAAPYGAINVSVPVATGAHLACVWLVNVGPGYNTPLGCQAVDTRGPAGTGTVATPAINKKVVAEAKKHIGQSYVWGATGPKSFDCSGLVMYSYGKQKYATPRVSEAQFAAARVIPASRAVPGDLVFWHDGVGDVYHVGIYLAPGQTVAAIDESEGVDYQKLWDTTIVTYGSFTHS